MFRHWALIAGVLAVPFFAAESVAVASNPSILWSQTSTASSYSDGYAIAMDSAGDVYAAGQTNGTAFGLGGTAYKGYVVEYAPNGSLLWDQVWTGSGCSGIALDQSGDVFVSTSSDVMKFSPSGGLLWTTPLASGAAGGGIAVDQSGNAYVTGTITGNGASQAYVPYVSKFSSSGSLTWTTMLNTPAPAYSNSIAVDASGNPVIAGTCDYFAVHQGISTGFAAKLNSTGQIVWNPTYGLPSGDDYAGCVAVNATGATYITMAAGSSLFGNGDNGCYLMKYDASNNLQWYQTFGYNGGPVSLALDPAGFEYVVGNGGIVSYNSSGSLVNSWQWNNDDLYLAYGDGDLGVAGCSIVNGLQSAYVSDMATPEPSTLVLLGIGAVSLLAYAWQRRRRTA